MPWREWPWEKISALVLSPGVPLTHPQPHGVVEHASAAKVPVIGDVELFAREIRPDAAQARQARRSIAITGTNGKSTTTALVGHILKACGFDAQVGGNIGKSVLELGCRDRRPSMCWKCPASRSIWRRGWCPMSRSFPTCRPITSTVMAAMDNYAAIKARMLKQTARDGQLVIRRG